jgi:hypothetical protein
MGAPRAFCKVLIARPPEWSDFNKIFCIIDPIIRDLIESFALASTAVSAGKKNGNTLNRLLTTENFNQ